MKDYAEIVKDFDRKKEEVLAELKEEFRNIFMGLVDSLFKTDSNIKAIQWTQYTPYFNDGDTCYFGVNELYVSFFNELDLEKEHEYDEDGHERYEAYYLLRDDNYFSNNPVLDHLYTFMNHAADLMEEIFGDHVEITISRKNDDTEDYNIITNSYDHD